MSLLEQYKTLRRDHQRCVANLSEFALSLVGRKIIFRRGSRQMVLAEVIGSKGSTLTIQNLESKRVYFIDLCTAELEQIDGEDIR